MLIDCVIVLELAALGMGLIGSDVSINQNTRPAMPMAIQTEAIGTRFLTTITKPHKGCWTCQHTL